MGYRSIKARPAALNLARYVREVTRDGKDMVDVLIEIAQAEELPPNVRVSAASEVLSRGFGKATQPIEVSHHADDAIDFSQWSEQALETFHSVMSTASPEQLSAIAKILSLPNGGGLISIDTIVPQVAEVKTA